MHAWEYLPNETIPVPEVAVYRLLNRNIQSASDRTGLATI